MERDNFLKQNKIISCLAWFFIFFFFLGALGTSIAGTGDPAIQGIAMDGTLVFDTGGAIDEFSTDGTLGGNSDTAVPTEKAVKTYADTKAPSTHATQHTNGTDDIQSATAGQKGLMTSTYASKLDGIEAAADVTDATNIASSIHGVDSKATPVDADELGLIDSAASNALKKLTWANLKATAKAYFDTLYAGIGANSDITSLSGLKYWIIDPTPDSDHGSTGKRVSRTAGENLVIGDVCYKKSDGKYWKADADAVATSAGELLLALDTISADASGSFLEKGYLRDDTWNWATLGQELVIHTTGGNPTVTRPTGSGDIIRIIGHVMTADVIKFDPSQTYIELD